MSFDPALDIWHAHVAVRSTLVFLSLAGSTMWLVAVTHSWLALRFKGTTMALYYLFALTSISVVSGTVAELIAARVSQ